MQINKGHQVGRYGEMTKLARPIGFRCAKVHTGVPIPTFASRFGMRMVESLDH